MPSFAQHQSATTVKMLYIGDSGTGKTGSLASLVKAGYELRIIDFDNGLDVLRDYVPQDKLDRIRFQTFTDEMQGTGGVVLPKGVPQAFPNALKQLTNWKTADENFGNVSTWPDNVVLVIDSMTLAGEAALRYVLALGGHSGKQAQLQHWGEAQRLLQGLLELLYSSAVKCNVIVTSHITIIEDETSGFKKGMPATIGKALSAKVPRLFNTMVQAKTVGKKRVILTQSAGIVDLKTSAPTRIPAELPLDTGLATIFETLRGPLPQAKG